MGILSPNLFMNATCRRWGIKPNGARRESGKTTNILTINSDSLLLTPCHEGAIKILIHFLHPRVFSWLHNLLQEVDQSLANSLKWMNN